MVTTDYWIIIHNYNLCIDTIMAQVETCPQTTVTLGMFFLGRVTADGEWKIGMEKE